MDNVIDITKRSKKMKEWQKPAEEPKNKQVQLVAVEMATLLYNLVQSNLQLIEKIEEMSDMMEHMEYQIDCLRKDLDQVADHITRSQPQTKSPNS